MLSASKITYDTHDYVDLKEKERTGIHKKNCVLSEILNEKNIQT